jgi:hypothetical protein
MNPSTDSPWVLYKGEYETAGGKGNYDKGVLTSQLSSWADFKGEIQRFRSHKGSYIWRGQEQHGAGWELKSTFDRHDRITYRDKSLEAHRNRFRKETMGRRGPNPCELNEDDLWALGQHNSLHTPLLDWTKSPYVAAFFAFWQKKKNAERRVVYALNLDVVRWHRLPSKSPFIELPDITAHENPRFLAQGGVFTKALDGEDIKGRVQKCYGDDNHRDRIVLAEILMPNSIRDECLEDLNWMNINHASLFPDIYGAAQHCNWQLDLDPSKA